MPEGLWILWAPAIPSASPPFTSALAERRVLHLCQAAELLGILEMTVRRDITGHGEMPIRD